MINSHQNQTYKDLQSLFRLFLASIFIIGGLNYIFTEMIEDLDTKTKNLETKQMIEENIARSLIDVREDISDILFIKQDSDNQRYFQDKIEERLLQINKYVKILKYGGTIKLGNSIQTNTYIPQLYGKQFNSFNSLSLRKITQDLQRFQDILKQDIFTQHKTKKDYVTSLNQIIKKIKTNNENMLNQTIYQINQIKENINLQKDRYIGYELLTIIFVIGSLLYLSNLISNQILKNSDIAEAANQEAQKMALKAKQASRAKSEFLANMSHEIRTPLNAILGFIDLLKERENDAEKLRYINTIQSSSNTLLGIINDILDFSKIESGNLQIEKIDFNTYEELNSLADLFRAKASEKSVSLTFKMDDKMPKALISDPLRIKQVIANLISNAIKFTPRNGRVELLISYAQNKLQVSVKDNGIGIEKDKQEAIFKAFSQAENSTTRKFGGTGLGLTISAKLVKILGGTLNIESQINYGSRFYFSIPVEVGSYQARNKKINLDNFNISGKRVLLVEDNKANQMFMSLLLKKFGLIFDIANDGLEAISAYKKEYYDLILMDENMPNLNGIEATKKILAIEAAEKRRHIPIVALTANALKGDREKFINAGMDEYLTKPVNKEKLLTMFTKFIKPIKEKI